MIKNVNLFFYTPISRQRLDNWMSVLTKYELLDMKDLPEKINLPEIKKALKVMYEMNLNKDEREIYDSHLDFLRIEEGAFEARFEAGKEEGIAIGKAEGIAEGETKGKLEIAKTMINKGFDEQSILEITGFTIGEFKKYFPENGKNSL